MSRRKRDRRVTVVTGEGWPESTPAADFEIAMLREHIGELIEVARCQRCGRELPNQDGVLGIKINGDRIELPHVCRRCLRTGNQGEARRLISLHAPNLAPILERVTPLERMHWIARQFQRFSPKARFAEGGGR